jgi:hypothetical protein
MAVRPKKEGFRLTFSEKLKVLFSGLWVFLGPFVKLFLSGVGTALAKAAMDAVTATATSMGDADGDAKRREAFRQIRAELTRQGIQVGASAINAAIEAAVQKLKDSSG